MTMQTHGRAMVPPPASDRERPLWSVMIPTYNCAHYLRTTLKSVLAQDPGPDAMQIEVVDDHSTRDDPRKVVEELGGGRVAFYQQPRNVGHTRNFDRCLQRAQGRLVHLLHGDDYVRPGFYQRMQRGFSEPRVGAAFCRHIYMDEHGHWQSISALERSESGVLADWLPKIASGPRISTPSVVVRRTVYEQLGSFDPRLSFSEDWEMWVRIATRYAFWFEPEPLAVYRIKREGALTDRAVREGRFAADMRRATEIIEEYLPAYLPPGAAVTRHARALYAGWAREAAQQALAAGDLRSAAGQLREAFRCSRSGRDVRAVAGLLAAEGLRRGGAAAAAGARLPGRAARKLIRIALA